MHPCNHIFFHLINSHQSMIHTSSLLTIHPNCVAAIHCTCSEVEVIEMSSINISKFIHLPFLQELALEEKFALRLVIQRRGGHHGCCVDVRLDACPRLQNRCQAGCVLLPIPLMHSIQERHHPPENNVCCTKHYSKNLNLCNKC